MADDSKSLGNNNKGNATAGEPINIATGNVFYTKTDYATQGQNQLSFSRYYNSRENYIRSLGSNWQSNYHRHIWTVSSSAVSVQRASGQILNFTLTGGAWAPDSDVDMMLTQSGSGIGSAWTLTDSDDSVETYTTINVNEARLNSITARNGYAQTLTYPSSTSTQMSSVTDSYGRSLSFSYNSNGLIQTVTTPDGRVTSYGYTTVASVSYLTSVTYPGAATVTYAYANTNVPLALNQRYQ